MRKIILIFMFSTLFALPPWTQGVDNKDGVYFVGVSKWYPLKDTFTKKTALKDALSDAYSQIAGYFGIKVTSSTDIQKYLTNKGISRNIKKEVKTKTSLFIFNIKPIKRYIEEKEDYYRIWVLVKLDKNTERQLKENLKKDRQKLNLLKTQINKAINNQNLFLAQNLLIKAKSLQSAVFDDELPLLEKRVKELKDNLIIPIISLDKTLYKPNEEIKIKASLNRPGYLYLFYDNKDSIEMFLPNEFQNNYIQNRLITFPNDDISIIAYENSINYPNKIIALGSKHYIDFSFLSDDKDGVYIFYNKQKVKQKIKECLKKGKCFKVVKRFKIKNKNTKINISIQGPFKKEILAFLRKFKIDSTPNGKKIVIRIFPKTSYSNELQTYIKTYEIVAIYNHRKDIEFAADKEELFYKIKEIIQCFISQN